MQNLKRMMALFLCFSMVANAVPPTNEDLERDNPSQTPTQTSSATTSSTTSTTTTAPCLEPGGVAEAGQVCCEGLTKNAESNVCEDPPLNDPTAVSCSDSTSCPTGMGCLAQRPKDLFTQTPA